jgi:LPS sulfotransferase NodH
MSHPALSYIICTAPRTGSTMLAEALASTTVAGRPKEYFDIHDYNEKFWIRKLGIGSDAEYFQKVIEAATTPNGVFGIKVLCHQAPVVLAKLLASRAGATASSDNPSLHNLLDQRLGGVHYIWLRRQNKLAQAISYYRASRTGLWRSIDTRNEIREVADHNLPFEYAVIDQYLSAVNQFDLQWQAYFRQNRLKILMIYYESFVGAYESTVHAVLDFLGIKSDRIQISQPRLTQQADERSLEWEQRYLEIRKTKTTRESKRATERHVQAEARLEEHKTTRPKRTKKTPQEPPLSMIGYVVSPEAPRILKAQSDREWMDATPRRFAYRCLPMVIANQAGWLVLNRHKLAVTWNGGVEQNALKIEYLSGQNPRHAISLFGSGILTFTIGCLFRTPPGYNLYVHGPANLPKDGICALEGIVETDWPESTFTMNWKVTRANHPIVFEENEPIAMLTPMPRHQLERFQPEIRDIAENPELAARHREWVASRQRHNAELRIPNSKAQREGWQRHYMRGTTVRFEPAGEHQTSLSLNDFVDKRKPG